MRYAALAIPGLFAVFGGPAVPQDEVCVDLVVGQVGPEALIVGEVCLAVQNDELQVTFGAADGWNLAETQLIVVPSSDSLPRAGEAGVPVVGRFPFRTAHAPVAKEFTYSMPLAELETSPGGEVVVAAHVGVVNATGVEEGGWGRGERFTPQGHPAMYFYYLVTGGVRRF